MKPHRGVLILVLGIVGLIMCPPLAIAAWFMGDNDLKKMKNGNMDSSGRDLTKAGRILGIIGTIYFFVIAVFMILFLAGTFLFHPSR
jgi:Trk-type K+ transport system membrane component